MIKINCKLSIKTIQKFANYIMRVLELFLDDEKQLKKEELEKEHGLDLDL